MKKQYTKKQILEAISYWKKQLEEADYSSYGRGDGTRTAGGILTAMAMPLALIANVILSMRDTPKIRDVEGNGDLRNELIGIFEKYTGGAEANDSMMIAVSQLLAKPLKFGDSELRRSGQVPPELKPFMPF